MSTNLTKLIKSNIPAKKIVDVLNDIIVDPEAEHDIKLKAVKIISEIRVNEEVDSEDQAVPVILFYLKHAETIEEIVVMLHAVFGIEKRKGNALVKTVATKNGLLLPEQRIAEENRQNTVLNTGEIDKNALYDDLVRSLYHTFKHSRSGSERMSAANELTKLCEYDTEVFHLMRKNQTQIKSEAQIAAEIDQLLG